MTAKRAIGVSVLLGFFIAVLFFGVRLPRDSDDEMIYVGLAAKIRASGFSAYNHRDLSIEPAGVFWKIAPKSSGNFLPSLLQTGLDYYDTGFFFNPPLYPAVLAVSHRLVGVSDAPLVLRRASPQAFYREQLYAALPGALAAAFFLWGVFALARNAFSEKAGVWAALFCATSPIFLVSAFKSWTDLPAAAFLVWALVWRLDAKREGWWKEIISGAFFGLAILTRTSALFAVPLFLGKNPARMGIRLAVAALIALPWFWRMTDYYGTPLHFPPLTPAQFQSEWFRLIARPWYFYLADLFYLSPVFLAAFAAGKRGTFPLWAWTLCFVGIFSVLLKSGKAVGLEDRYLLPAYPALAVLAAAGLEKLESKWPRAAVYGLAALAAAWSLKLAVTLVFLRESVQFVPF